MITIPDATQEELCQFRDIWNNLRKEKVNPGPIILNKNVKIEFISTKSKVKGGK